MSEMILTLIFAGSWFLPQSELKLGVKSIKDAEEITEFYKNSTKVKLIKSYVTVTGKVG